MLFPPRKQFITKLGTCPSSFRPRNPQSYLLSDFLEFYRNQCVRSQGNQRVAPMSQETVYHSVILSRCHVLISIIATAAALIKCYVLSSVLRDFHSAGSPQGMIPFHLHHILAWLRSPSRGSVSQEKPPFEAWPVRLRGWVPL